MSAENRKILITGTAGFIGFHLADRLIREGADVAGVDNINDYYDVNLKYSRLKEAGIGRKEIDADRQQNGYSRLVRVESRKHTNYTFYRLDLSDRQGMEELFDVGEFDVVIHLAAQAGVRYSLENPHVYIDSNITGFLNILEGCRRNPPDHLIYASSSSVYGFNKEMPFRTTDNVDYPVSLYAATKKSNELMAHTYSHLFNIPVTGLRFFTVYGPWGRPDMAYYKFASLITSGKPIDVYNYGRMSRDFTYIDDIVESVVRLIPKAPVGTEGKTGSENGGTSGQSIPGGSGRKEDAGAARSRTADKGEESRDPGSVGRSEDSQNILDSGESEIGGSGEEVTPESQSSQDPESLKGSAGARGSSPKGLQSSRTHQTSAGPMQTGAPYRLFNIGNNSPVDLMEFIGEIEKNLDTEAEKNLIGMQPGDVPSTWADVSDLFDFIDYKPDVSLQDGIRQFMTWYKEYYRL